MNIALILSYDGTAYHGWQIQKTDETVCGTLKKAIEKTVEHPVSIHGCGRTDAGVHAKKYVASFRSDTRIPMDKLPFALNSRLPDDIAISRAFVAGEDFHPINSCVKKQYTYYIQPNKIRDPLLVNRTYHYPRAIDMELCRNAAGQFIGTHDFACVKSEGTPVKNTVRTLYSFEVFNENGLIAFEMTASGFLYNMARALVGTVLYCNEGKINDIPALIAGCSRTEAGPTVPPHGLYMTGVWYPNVDV